MKEHVKFIIIGVLAGAVNGIFGALAGGLAGGFLGGRIFKRIPLAVIRRIFAAFIIYGGVRNLL